MAAFSYWFDFSCPYAYIASTQVEALAARTGATLQARPMLLGGVFRARNVPDKLFATHGEAKTRHNVNDIRRSAAQFDVPLSMPAGHPFRTVEALRALLVVGQPFLPLAHRFFRAYWVENRDIGQQDVLRSVLTDAGHDAEAVLVRAQSPEIKDELRRRTDEAIELGVFGAPSFFVKDELYFGQDRMDLVEAALGGTPSRRLPAAGSPLAPVDFWFDYSSPYSYFAAERVEAVFGDAARWRPMLLGAVFRAVEMANVPLLAMSEAKQRHAQHDFIRQAKHAGCPIQFPTRFPMNSVLPLRVTIAAKATESREGRRLVQRIYRAYWAEDQDISNPEVVRALADEVGLDGSALVEASGTPEIKSALRELTDEAVAAGVFGAPSFVVQRPGSAASLYWGADRLDMAALAASGDARVA